MPTKCEADIFALLGLDYLEPEDRDCWFSINQEQILEFATTNNLRFSVLKELYLWLQSCYSMAESVTLCSYRSHAIFLK